MTKTTKPMKEQELKPEHIVGHLPFGLKAKCQFLEGDLIGNLDAIDISGNQVQFLFDGEPDLYETYFINGGKFKFILYPLSDLTKPMQHKGKKFVPIKKLGIVDIDIYDQIEDFIKDIRDGSTQYRWIQKLFEWKMDVNGLIEKNLAISVHELSETPYK